MAQPLQNINIAAPAFKGLNTQDSPLSGDAQYASVADNVVVDNYGRIGARKGLETLTTDNTILGGDRPHVIHEYEDADGNTEVFCVANNKILKGTTTLTDITPSGYTITDNHFQIVNFNDKCYFFNQNHAPLVYDTAGGLRLCSAEAGATGTQPQGKIVLSAFGRLWVAGVDGEPNMMYNSDLLIGESWEISDLTSANSRNFDKIWPDGSDKIMALAAWNNYLVIFGYNSIVMYQGAESPDTMVLADTVSGIGCIGRYTVHGTGTDLLFMSTRGLMSLGRTIQEKSAPMNDVSKNIRDDLLQLWQLEEEEIYATYSPINSFYLLSLPTNNVVYCFDTRGFLDNGAYRVTRWTTTRHYTFTSRQDDTLLVGNTQGISKYAGYLDNGNPYTVRYYSNPLSFGDPSHLKFLKKIVPTVIGGSGLSVIVKWSYDFSEDYSSFPFTLSDATAAYFNVDEFEDAEFTSGASIVKVNRINATGSGNLIKVGLEATINNAALSIQEFNLQATMGRTH